MSDEIPDDLFEIDDPEIDPEAIVAEIRARIERRRAELGPLRADLATVGAVGYPGEPECEPFDADLYDHLRRVNELYTQIGVEAALDPSPASKMPLLGVLWRRVRRQAHELVLFYLGRLVVRQVTVNRHLVGALNRVALQLQEQQREIRALREALDRAEER